MKNHYFFRSLAHLCQQIPRTCDLCGQVKRDTTRRIPLHPHPVQSHLHTWACDHFSLPRKTPSGHTHVISFIESFTGWPEMALCKGVSALESATHFVNLVVANWGCPSTIITDRSSSFVNSFFRHICQILGVHAKLTSSRSPMSNGKAERLIQSVKKAIKFRCDTDADIERTLPAILIGLRAVRSKVTGYSPFYVSHGYPMSLGLPGTQMDSPQVSLHNLRASEHAYIDFLKTNLDKIHECVKDNIVTEYDKMKRDYDKHHRVQESQYTIGS